MTGNLSHPLGRLDPDRIPRRCPKCGDPMVEPYAERLVSHLKIRHPDALGIAVHKADGTSGREFSYIRPAFGQSNVWIIVWLDHPYEVANLVRSQYQIVWRGDGPREGIRE